MSLRHPLILFAMLGLSACDPVTMGLVTAGGGVAVNHQMSSTITRTFSHECGDVHAALLRALAKMSITVTRREQRQQTEILTGVAGERAVSMRVEPVTRTSTLLEVAVHQDLLTMDGATAREIVAQTEHALDSPAAGSTAVAVGASATPGVTGAEGSTGHTTYFGYDASPTATSAPVSPRERKTAQSRAKSAGTHAPAAAGATGADATGSAATARVAAVNRTLATAAPP